MIGIQNLRSTDKDSWNPVPGIQSPESTAWNSDSNTVQDSNFPSPYQTSPVLAKVYSLYNFVKC